MQNETSLYEMPPERMVFTHEQLGAGRELGEAEIVNTIWGKARVRIIHKESRSGWVWLLATLCVLMGIAVGWYLVAGQSAEVSAPAERTAPPASTPPDAPAGTTLAPSSEQPLVATPVPTPAAADATATPHPFAPSPAGTDKPQPAVSSQTRTGQTEPPVQPHPAPAKSGKKQAPSGSPSLNTPTADIPATQPEGTANPANQPAKENSASPTDAETPDIPSVKAEPPKNDQPGSHR